MDKFHIFTWWIKVETRIQLLIRLYHQKSSAFGFCPLGSDSKVPSANMPTILHSSLPDAGSVTHGNLDAFYNSKDQALGLAGLDSNTLLKVSEIPKFGGTISYYVDCNYTLGSNDGSKLRPFTTI